MIRAMLRSWSSWAMASALRTGSRGCCTVEDAFDLSDLGLTLTPVSLARGRQHWEV